MSSSVQHTLSHYPAIAPRFNLPLQILPEHPCSYFPDRHAQTRAFLASEVPPDAYHDLMDAGFRRSGRMIYQPVCRGCRDCVPLRVDVKNFTPDKSQRRCRRKNLDLTISVAPPRADDEAFALYVRYLNEWHGEPSLNGADRESFEAFLYDSPVKTLEFRYRDAAQNLVAVGLCDVCDRSLSSVYFYFDPRQCGRSPGTFGALHEIDYALQIGAPYYYLGYWIHGCGSMKYKAAFRPFELLDTDGRWRREGDATAAIR